MFRCLASIFLLTGLIASGGLLRLSAQNQPVTHTLPNGIQVVYLQDTSRPLLEAALIRSTTAFPESEGSDGLHLLLARLFWDRGPDSLNYKRYGLRRAVRTDAWHRDGQTYLYMRCRPQRMATALSLLGSALQDDLFPKTDQDRISRNYAQVLQRFESDPGVFLDQQVLALLYGRAYPAAHPYGQFVDMKSMPQKALQAGFRATLAQPGGTLMLTGPDSADRVLAAADSLLGRASVYGLDAGKEEFSAEPFEEQQTALFVNDLALAPRIEMAWRLMATDGDWAARWVALANAPGNPFQRVLLGDSLATACRWELRRGQPMTLVVWAEPLPDRVERCGQRLRQELAAVTQEAIEWESVATEEALREDLWAVAAVDVPRLWFEQWQKNPSEAPEMNELLGQVEEVLGKGAFAGAVLIGSEWEEKVTLENVFGASPVVPVVVEADTNPPVDTLPPPPDYSWLDSLKIYFQSGSNAPDLPSLTRIDRVAALLRSEDSLCIHVNGYTDGLGDGVTNYALSIERAEAVRQIFIQQYQLPPSRLIVVGWGEAFPEYPDDTPKHRGLNRRVTFDIVSDETNY